MSGIICIAESIRSDLMRRLPSQRKTQRDKLALLVATMLDVRSANLMDLAASLPIKADRTDMRYQWITRYLGNSHVISNDIFEVFARDVLEQAALTGSPLVLIMDQTKVSDRHQVLMVALRWGERALPLAWHVEETAGPIGFKNQKTLLDRVLPWVPQGAPVILMGDRFYGSPDLIVWCQDQGWDYRLRLKGKLKIYDPNGLTTTGACAKNRVHFLENAILTQKRIRTNIGIIHDSDHDDPWIIAMSARPCYQHIIEYSDRWGIDVDQSWRLSRIRLREVGLVLWRRESSPRWWCCTHSLELCDGVGVGVYKLGRAAAACWNVAA